MKLPKTRVKEVRNRVHTQRPIGGNGVPCIVASVPVARVGRPIDRVFDVEFIINRASRKSKMFDEVVAELDFYLVTKGERDPWLYGQYHCGTAANVYSGVHWSVFNGDSNGSASGEVKE